MKDPALLPFLARPGYRRRRLIEAIRLVPYLGLVLILFPLLWTGDGDDYALTSRAMIYLFGVWGALILAAAIGAAALRRNDDTRPGGTRSREAAKDTGTGTPDTPAR